MRTLGDLALSAPQLLAPSAALDTSQIWLGWDLDVHSRSFPPTCPFHSFHGTKCRNAGQKGASVQYILARSPVQIISEQNLGEVCSLYQFRHRHINQIYFFFIFSQVFRMDSALPS